MKAPFIVALALFVLVAVPPLGAQFSPAFLQNESYWSDGKAEVDFYDAQVMRDGQLRHCEATMILARDTLEPELVSSRTPQPKADTVSGIRMTEMFTVPLGLFSEQNSVTLFWNLQADFLQGTFITGGRGGNRVFRAQSLPEMKAIVTEGWDQHAGGGLEYDFKNGGKGILYDELPFRVRTTEFKNPPVELQFEMAPSLASPGEFKTATASYRVTERAIEVEVKEGDALDRFVLDPQFPFLLREWKTRDGSYFKLKNSLKTDLGNYSKNGDREKALKDPMLRHPD